MRSAPPYIEMAQDRVLFKSGNLQISGSISGALERARESMKMESANKRM